jgi:coenzyme F420-reducing hydrogenase beta subunit
VIMGSIVTPEQLSEVCVRVNTLRGLIAGLVEQTRALDKRYPEDRDLAALRVEFAGLLCEANKAKIEMDLLCRPAAVVMREPQITGRAQRLRRDVWPDGKMAAAGDDSLAAEG